MNRWVEAHFFVRMSPDRAATLNELHKQNLAGAPHKMFRRYFNNPEQCKIHAENCDLWVVDGGLMVSTPSGCSFSNSYAMAMLRSHLLAVSQDARAGERPDDVITWQYQTKSTDKANGAEVVTSGMIAVTSVGARIITAEEMLGWLNSQMRAQMRADLIIRDTKAAHDVNEEEDLRSILRVDEQIDELARRQAEEAKNLPVRAAVQGLLHRGVTPSDDMALRSSFGQTF